MGSSELQRLLISVIVSFSQSEFAIKILAKDTKTYKYKGKTEKERKLLVDKQTNKSLSNVLSHYGLRVAF